MSNNQVVKIHIDNDTIAYMQRYLAKMLRDIASHSEKYRLDSGEIISLLKELADASEAQNIVVKLRDIINQ